MAKASPKKPAPVSKGKKKSPVKQREYKSIHSDAQKRDVVEVSL